MEKENLKNKAKEKVEEILGLNDTSVDAKLYLNGKEYQVDNFETEFQQSFDFKGEPQREVKGGILTMTFNQLPDEQLNYWMFRSKTFYSGSIVFTSYSRIANAVLTIDFTNACCARYSTDDGAGGFYLTIVVTAESILINGIKHKNKR
ncbi:MAG: hypothetical protein FWF46_09345 [Oscillospiraceae bacterium]|nr:hypothetical protein [Oscillospiraceae bacterium]